VTGVGFAAQASGEVIHKVASVALLVGSLDGASGGVGSEADDTVPSLADRAAGHVIRIDFGQFVSGVVVGVAGDLVFGIGQTFELGRLCRAGKASPGSGSGFGFESITKPETRA